MDLDNLLQIKMLDKSNMMGSIMALASQCHQVWNDLKSFNLPAKYQKISKIVVAGMGGSALGAHILKSLYRAELKASIEIINDYHLPVYTNKDTLVFLLSYSGTTEEILSCAKEAKKIGAKVLVVAAGGELAKLAAKEKWPAYIFEPKNNPCNSPRMGLGYSLFSLMVLFGKLKLIKFNDREAQKVIKTVKRYNELWRVQKVIDENAAKLLAKQLINKIPFFLGSGILAGSLHTLSNQINENAKVFAGWFLIPEANHHLMEGLTFPDFIKKDLALVFFESLLDEERIQKRMVITKEVAKKSGMEVAAYQLQEKDWLGQSFEMLVLGSYLGFYLAMIYGIDPTPIPAVDYFKQKMKS